MSCSPLFAAWKTRPAETDRLGVIFDVDGVLVDSYRAHYVSWARFAEESGFSISEEEFAVSFGRTSHEIIDAQWEGRLTAEEIARLVDRKEALYREIIEADFPEMDGAVELIDALNEAGFALAIGSSAPPENIELVMNRLECGHLFGAQVNASDVTRGKPDPQVFLIGAKRLGIPPACCAVIEDAPPGIEAANAAGMTAIGLASTGRTREELAEADLVVSSLRELL